MRKVRTFLCIFTAVFLLLCGCSQVAVPSEVYTDTIAMDENGQIQYYMTDVFDKDYYDLNELKDMALDEVDDFIDENGKFDALAVVIDDVYLVESGETVAGTDVENTVEAGIEHVVLKYIFSNYSAYEEFVDVDFFYGTVAEAVKNNKNLNAVIKSVKDQSVIAKEDLLKKTDYSVIITDANLMIYCPSKILYLSDNAKYADGYVDATEADGPVVIVMK